LLSEWLCGLTFELGENGNFLATNDGDLRLDIYFAQIEQIEENNKRMNSDDPNASDATPNGESAADAEK
jgi:hypothetical protein